MQSNAHVWQPLAATLQVDIQQCRRRGLGRKDKGQKRGTAAPATGNYRNTKAGPVNSCGSRMGSKLKRTPMGIDHGLLAKLKAGLHLWKHSGEELDCKCSLQAYL